ncbi:MAG: aminodeoxychorismate/anthranilate synthase component II [Pelagibacterales bacterium]|nr:aminodeoxychorismate/anthranilate synthase component II [Pelagibacterales bacterium]
MMKVIVIDNYDSFTYNLVHYLEELNCEVTVKRNDQIDIKEIKDYDKIVLSPGPGIPNEAGLLKEIISFYSDSKSILGVCLGHQAIAEVFGAELINLKSVYHGVATEIKVTKEDPIFRNLSSPLKVGRYHSWIVKEPLPKDLEPLAHDDNGQLMALKHKFYDVRGVQFHPESILTEGGKSLLNNWLKIKQ